MAVTYGDDVVRKYSAALPAARVAQEIAQKEQKRILLFSNVTIFPMGLSAILNEPYFINGFQMQCPWGPGKCLSSQPLPQPKQCPGEAVCFLVTSENSPPVFFDSEGEWQLVFRPSNTINERIYLYRWLSLNKIR
jgi:hypothetical protein